MVPPPILATSDISPSLHFPTSPELNQCQHHQQWSVIALACTQRRQQSQSLAPLHIHHQIKPQSHPPMSASQISNQLQHCQLRRLQRSPRQLHSLNWSIWWWVFWTLSVSCLRTLQPNCVMKWLCSFTKTTTFFLHRRCTASNCLSTMLHTLTAWRAL